jgi:hypothetical protein
VGLGGAFKARDGRDQGKIGPDRGLPRDRVSKMMPDAWPSRPRDGAQTHRGELQGEIDAIERNACGSIGPGDAKPKRCSSVSRT